MSLFEADKMGNMSERGVVGGDGVGEEGEREAPLQPFPRPRNATPHLLTSCGWLDDKEE